MHDVTNKCPRTGACSPLGIKETNTEELCKLLKISLLFTFQPKQYVFEHFAELMALIPTSEIQLTILPSLVNLWQGKNWRVRLGVVQSLPCLFSKLVSSSCRFLMYLPPSDASRRRVESILSVLLALIKSHSSRLS